MYPLQRLHQCLPYACTVHEYRSQTGDCFETEDAKYNRLKQAARFFVRIIDRDANECYYMVLDKANRERVSMLMLETLTEKKRSIKEAE
jgi:hypothetical protein